MKTSKVLREAKRLIDSPEKWFGPPGTIGSNCAGTAINAMTNRENDWNTVAHLVFERAVGLRRGFIAFWNNAHERTHAEVVEAFDRAIALAEKEEAPRISDTEYTKRFLEGVKVFDRRATKETI